MTTAVRLPRRFAASAARDISYDEVRRLIARYRTRHTAAVHPNWKPRPGMIYTQVRAIAARINQNWDAWPSSELKKSYRTFIGKPCFVNHGNEDPDLARGVVIAARYVESGADKYIETIMETDGVRYPKLGKELRTGGLDSVSMGVEAGFTKCSICNNKATDLFDMCNHVKFHKGEYLKHAKTGKKTLCYENCYKLGFFELSYVFDPADETAVVSRVIAASKIPVSPESSEWYDTPPVDHLEKKSSWYRSAYDEVEAPEDIDTLRDESEDDTDDFHHWVQSPPELREPDFDKSKRLDRQQETEGLDADRRSEDAEEYGAPGEESEYEEDPKHPPMPVNPPATKKSRRTQGVHMARYFYADDDEESGGDDGGQEDPGQEADELVSEAEQDLADYDAAEGGGDEDEGSDDDEGYDEGDEDEGPPEDEGDEEEPEEEDDEDDSGGDSGGNDQPPWLQEGSRQNRRKTTGGPMTGSTLAQRGRVASNGRRHFYADDNGFTDGGPYGRNDLGEQEEVFITGEPGPDDAPAGGGVPGGEAVCLPDEADHTSNTENNLVARKQGWAHPQFDPNHYQRLADVVANLPPAQRRAMADKMVGMLSADNNRFNWRTFFEAARVPVVKEGSRYFYAEDLVEPCKVDPPLSGSDEAELKGDHFESVALPDETSNPKDASIHAFRVFDRWLQQATGRTARQHANANFIRRAAASYAGRHANPQGALQSLFPTLEYILHEARKIEEGNMSRYANESLETAAPGGRIDVEAPVKNVTDEKAQASQFDLGDFAHNAFDQVADPDLEPVRGNAGTWAPDKQSSRKLASGVEAVRCADAHIGAMPNKYTEADRWQLTARFETMRQAVVRDRTRLLEDVIAENRGSRKVHAASSRGTKGIPPGLGTRRTAGSQRVAANDPDTDSLMFFS